MPVFSFERVPNAHFILERRLLQREARRIFLQKKLRFVGKSYKNRNLLLRRIIKTTLLGTFFICFRAMFLFLTKKRKQEIDIEKKSL